MRRWQVRSRSKQAQHFNPQSPVPMPVQRGLQRSLSGQQGPLPALLGASQKVGTGEQDTELGRGVRSLWAEI
ncbi:hypothetical protein CDV36_013683 [Fusarium kuroshium]|uniref:Uncharacterized protein n=1 Tax=Fusarium kuroshium TaxID=2010991 RepID=A0A3M2RNC9_9HYPO|nr:hypothetical protein CDV36_013683 [Fusarium kuroshium]